MRASDRRRGVERLRPAIDDRLRGAKSLESALGDGLIGVVERDDKQAERRGKRREQATGLPTSEAARIPREQGGDGERDDPPDDTVDAANERSAGGGGQEHHEHGLNPRGNGERVAR